MMFSQRTPRVDFSDNPFYEDDFSFYDQRLKLMLDKRDEQCCDFFRCIALCHTVMSEYKNGAYDVAALIKITLLTQERYFAL